MVVGLLVRVLMIMIAVGVIMMTDITSRHCHIGYSVVIETISVPAVLVVGVMVTGNDNIVGDNINKHL